MSHNRLLTGAELQQQPLCGCVRGKPASPPGAASRAGARSRAVLERLEGSRLCPMRIQLQLAPAAPTHLCEACWPRGRHSEVGLGALSPGVWNQILGSRLQLIRARRGGGKPGIRLCPAARPRRGMVSPSPARRAPEPTSNRGAAGQPRALAQPRGERLAPRSRRPASAAQSTLQAVLREGRRPPAAALSFPPPPTAAAAAAAKGRSHAPRSSGESAQRAFAGPRDRRSGAPPFLPPASPTSLPPSLPPSLASSLPLALLPAPAHGAPPIQNL